MEEEGRNKEQDGVGDRNWEPGQESGAGVLGNSRKERLKALHQPLCAPDSSLEKTKSTCLEWGVNVPRKEQCLLPEFPELLLNHITMVTVRKLGSCPMLMVNIFF